MLRLGVRDRPSLRGDETALRAMRFPNDTDQSECILLLGDRCVMQKAGSKGAIKESITSLPYSASTQSNGEWL